MARHRPLRLALLAAITLLGAFLRLYRIDSLPPGETYDPAFYGLDALAILQGERPIFFETNLGREALFSYLVAACVAIFGVGSLAIHLASAIVGTLTIPAAYWVAEEVFHSVDDESLLKRYGSLVTALALALSYWHLNWSRYGVRAVLVPLFASATTALFWRGVRTRSHWAFVGCGFLLGSSMYTYQAAWLLPVLVSLGFLAAVLWPPMAPFRGRHSWQLATRHAGTASQDRDKGQVGNPALRDGKVVESHSRVTRQDWVHLGLVFVVALVVFAPLGHYFVTHPDSSSERVDQVYVLGDSQKDKLDALIRGWVRTTLVFTLRGDDKPTINLPGRPALNPFFSVAFALGIGVSLFRIRRPFSFFTLAWLAVMSVPGVLAGQGPTAKRIIGTLPAVTMLIAVGTLVPLEELRRWARGRVAVPDRRRRGGRYGGLPRNVAIWYGALTVTASLVVVAGFLYSGVRTYRDYFVVWGQDPALFTHFEAGLAAIGQYIAARPAGERIYVSPVYVGHPSILYNSLQRPGVKGYHGRFCIVLPVDGAPDITYLVVRGQDESSLDALSEVLPQGQVIGEGPLHHGRPYFLAYHVPAGVEAKIEPAYELRANWADAIQLLGYDLSSPIPVSGDDLQVTLYYRATREMETDYTVFVQLLGPHNPTTGSPLWSQDDSEPCRRYRPTSSWEVDEILLDRFRLTIPEGAPGGEYTLITGFYDWRTSVRLPVVDAKGEVVSDHLLLTQVRLSGGE